MKPANLSSTPGHTWSASRNGNNGLKQQVSVKWVKRSMLVKLVHTDVRLHSGTQECRRAGTHTHRRACAHTETYTRTHINSNKHTDTRTSTHTNSNKKTTHRHLQTHTQTDARAHTHTDSL